MEFLEEIWTTIRQNKSRSLLTGFGVFWGMMMLIVLVGAGLGFTGGMKDSIDSMPANSVMFYVGPTSKPYKGMPQGRDWSIQLSDIDVIKKEANLVDLISPSVWGDNSEKNTRYDNIEDQFTIQGVLPVFSQLFTIPLQEGRFITDLDVDNYRKVCVIGSTVYKKLCKNKGKVTGTIIYLNNIPYRIIGVIQQQDQKFSDFDETVFLPISTLQRAYNSGQAVHLLTASARPGISAEDMSNEVKSILRRIHNIAPNDEKAIHDWNSEEFFNAIRMVILGLRLLLWIIGLGTLISGAVGVMNIMLVTIRERTREIGVRRALGASPWMIVRQILAESVLLTSLSGILGIMVGIGLLNLLNMFMSGVELDIPINSMEVSFSLAMGALFIIVVIGLLAGLMPALRALRIKPIEALSEE